MRHNETTLQHFCDTHLPGIVSKDGPLRVLFHTYNTVHGVPPGQDSHGEMNLTTQVVEGDLRYSSGVDLGFMMADVALSLGEPRGALHFVEKAIDQGYSDGAEAFDRTQSQLDTNEHSDVAFIYAGVSALEQGIEFARSLKESGVSVFLVACNCGEDSKMAAVDEHGFDGLIMNSACGGEYLMADVYHALIDARRTAFQSA